MFLPAPYTPSKGFIRFFSLFFFYYYLSVNVPDSFIKRDIVFLTFSKSKSVKYLSYRCSGCLLTYTLGSQLNWKIIAMGATLVPFSAMVVAFFVPDSPAFLIQKVTKIQLQNLCTTSSFGTPKNSKGGCCSLVDLKY